MKKIPLRTKIALTIAGLLALTRIFYAASPTQFGSVPEPIGVATAPSQLIVSEYCSQNLDTIDCLGNVSLLATIPGPVGPCGEKYMTIAPSQSALAGFTPCDVFVTQGTAVYKVLGASGTLFATITGCQIRVKSVDPLPDSRRVSRSDLCKKRCEWLETFDGCNNCAQR